jgi:hypothetical protein
MPYSLPGIIRVINSRMTLVGRAECMAGPSLDSGLLHITAGFNSVNVDLKKCRGGEGNHFTHDGY